MSVKVSRLEAALQARPFRPFEIRVDAQGLVVRHPEQVFLAQNRTTVIVDAGDRIHILDAAQISKLARLRRTPTKAPPKHRPR